MDCLQITKLFWCNLSTGGFIIGYLGIFDSIFFMSYLSRFQYYDLRDIVVLVIFLFIVRITCHIVVNIGIYTGNHIIMIPYLVSQVLFITAYGLFIVAYLFIARFYADGLFVFVVSALYIGIQIVFYMIIYANYLLFKEQHLYAAVQQALNGRNLVDTNLNRGTGAPLPLPPDYEFATTSSKLNGESA